MRPAMHDAMSDPDNGGSLDEGYSPLQQLACRGMVVEAVGGPTIVGNEGVYCDINDLQVWCDANSLHLSPKPQADVIAVFVDRKLDAR